MAVDWTTVHAFADLLETKSAGGTFEEWWSSHWKPIEERCRDIAANKFITKMALQEFKDLNLDKFVDDVEYKRLLKHCLTVDIDSHDYMDIAWTYYRAECLKLL
tara:strand:+ start:832 stop:1143 length:312 start_codon:yes stop_codon:yes gene_type:complete